MYNFKQEDLTLVVPGKDAQNTVGATLRSLQPHMQAGGRCIMVDDGSTDNTGSIMQAFADRWGNARYVRLEDALGVGNARNIGLENTETALWGNIDADDWVHPDYYPRQIELFQKHEELDFTRTSFIECHGNLRKLISVPFEVVDRPFDPNLGIMPLSQKTLVDHAQMWSGVYSTLFLKNNRIGYDELSTAEDQIMCWKTQILGKRMIASSESRFFYRRGDKKSLTAIGDDRQLDFLQSMENILNFLIESGRVEFLPKAARKCLALICFHIDRQERLDHGVSAMLLSRSRVLLNIWPQEEMQVAIEDLDMKRRKQIEEIL